MSALNPAKRITATKIMAQKGKAPIVALTAYHAHTSRLLDKHVDVILVGDSLGMVVHGFDTTLPVTLDMMILQAKAVMRGAKRACVVVDLPFGSYEESKEQAFHSACRVIKETGAQAVKLEGGAHMAPTIAFLTARGIPIMAHIGLTPQSVNMLGGFKIQGKDEKSWQGFLDDAEAVAKAGAFSVVIEGVREALATKITNAIAIPTIGIGASADCDGQILVLEDILGLSDWSPKFAKRYMDLESAIESAVTDYADEVRNRQFPSPEHLYR